MVLLVSYMFCIIYINLYLPLGQFMIVTHTPIHDLIILMNTTSRNDTLPQSIILHSFASLLTSFTFLTRDNKPNVYG